MPATQPVMKTLAESDLSHRYASLWKIERRDGTNLYFTNHNEPIFFRDPSVSLVNGSLLDPVEHEFKPAGGFNATAHETSDSFRGRNVDFAGVLTSDRIKFEDLRLRKYHGAKVTEYQIDWRWPYLGFLSKDIYFVGEVVFTKNVWEVQLVGLSQLMRNQNGDVFAFLCRHNLGDAFDPDSTPSGEPENESGNPLPKVGCHFDLATHRLQGGIVANVDTTAKRLKFEVSHPGLKTNPLPLTDTQWNGGEMLFESGANQGFTREIFNATRAVTDGNFAFELATETPHDVVAGDIVRLTVGCMKREDPDCVRRGQQENFGGYSDIPDQLEARKTPN